MYIPSFNFVFFHMKNLVYSIWFLYLYRHWNVYMYTNRSNSTALAVINLLNSIVNTFKNISLQGSGLLWIAVLITNPWWITWIWYNSSKWVTFKPGVGKLLFRSEGKAAGLRHFIFNRWVGPGITSMTLPEGPSGHTIVHLNYQKRIISTGNKSCTKQWKCSPNLQSQLWHASISFILITNLSHCLFLWNCDWFSPHKLVVIHFSQNIGLFHKLQRFPISTVWFVSVLCCMTICYHSSN